MKRFLLITLAVTLIAIPAFFISGCDEETTSPNTPAPTAPPSSNNETPPPAPAEPPILSFVDVVKKVKPSVVSVNVTYTATDYYGGTYTGEAAGSGWIISEDGYIITNSHVISDAISVNVLLDDGREFPAVFTADDYRTDLAIIKINANDLPAVDIGDSSELLVGEPVAAIGNALGLGVSMKGGWVSRLDVSVTFDEGTGVENTLYNLVETDAAINPGNSGGPLVNYSGEVIGITSAKLSAVDIEGVGYAISINSAMPIIEDLIEFGYVKRAFLGVSGLLSVDEAVAEYYSLEASSGVLIRGIVEESPAEAAGIEAMDIITKVNGSEITNVEDLLLEIHSKQVGETVAVEYLRGESKGTVTVTLAETPN